MTGFSRKRSSRLFLILVFSACAMSAGRAAAAPARQSPVIVLPSGQRFALLGIAPLRVGDGMALQLQYRSRAKISDSAAVTKEARETGSSFF